MAFLSNNTVLVDDTGSIRVPPFANNALPSSPVVGQVIYNTTSRRMEIYDGVWKAADDIRKSIFLTRQTITTSYVMGGYKDSSPWRNVNRMVHATDVCTNLGDQIDSASAYTSGACSLTKGFIWDIGGMGSSGITAGFNLATETSAGTSVGWNTTPRNDPATIFKETEYAWILGGGVASTEQFNMTTEVQMGAITADRLGYSVLGNNNITDTATTGTAALSGETHGYIWANIGGAKLIFATGLAYHVAATPGDVSIGASAPGNAAGANGINSTGAGIGMTVEGSPTSLFEIGMMASNHPFNSNAQQKGVQGKTGRGWFGNEGTYNGGYNLRRIQFSTDTSLGTVSKPVGNCGEENFDMGQAHQYMIGCYDGAQNNRGWKFTYATEAGFELGSGSVRTGVPGGSSGHCVWKG